MVTTSETERLADRLVAARQTLQAQPLPAGMDKIQALRVKEAVLARLSADGARRRLAYKVSMSGTWGALFEGDVLPSGARIERARLFDPLIETEAVFRLREPIHADMDMAQVLSRADVCAGIEIADSRWDGWCPSDSTRFTRPTAGILKADNALAFLLVLDDCWVDANTLDLPRMRIDARRDGVTVAGGTLDHVMGHPAQVVLWLARELAACGARLDAGLMVATGNPYRAFVTLPRGQRGTFESVFPGVGTASVHFV